MGSDFHFGVNRQGTAEYLSRLAHHDGISRVIIASLLDKPKYSSSRVRELLTDGEVSCAREILGYPYFMIGRVKHGSGRGHSMKYPTANIDIAGRNCLCPCDGVYACAVIFDGWIHAGAVSIGRNPTFGTDGELRCEVHIPGFDGDLYGHELTVLFLERLRGMRTFSGSEELAGQIARDVETCRKIFAAENSDILQKFAAHSGEKISEVIRLV
jgi:riboflavin kinase/FMN adenylyltransferase